MCAAAAPAWCRRASAPACCSGSGARCSPSQPPITGITIEDNGFRRWYAAARVLGGVSIALATLSVAFNVYWRLRYLFVTNGAFGGQDVATIITTLLYGAEALIALVIASRWLTEKTAAARLATTALGALGRAGGHAGVDPAHRPRRRRLPRLRAEHVDGRRRIRGLPVLGGRGRDRGADDAVRHLPDQAADVGRLPVGRGEMPDAHRVLGVRRGRAAGHRLPGRLVIGSAPCAVRHRRDDGVQPDHRPDRAVAAPPTRQGRESRRPSSRRSAGRCSSSRSRTWPSASRSPRGTPRRRPTPSTATTWPSRSPARSTWSSAC